MKIKIVFLAILIPAILFGGILISMVADVWTTTTDKKPATYASGSNEGEYNPADIRGSYTFAEVSELFKIDLDVLYGAFNIPEGTDGTTIKMKELETIYGADSGIGNESVQVFVALYNDLPIEFGDVSLPESAANLLLEKGNLAPEEKEYLLSQLTEHHSPATNEPLASAAATEQPKASGSGSAGTGDGTNEEQLVKGSTTFQQVLDAGITTGQIEEIIGSAMPPTNQTVKDYCNSVGLSFSDVKDKLNALAK